MPLSLVSVILPNVRQIFHTSLRGPACLEKLTIQVQGKPEGACGGPRKRERKGSTKVPFSSYIAHPKDHHSPHVSCCTLLVAIFAQILLIPLLFPLAPGHCRLASVPRTMQLRCDSLASPEGRPPWVVEWSGINNIVRYHRCPSHAAIAGPAPGEKVRGSGQKETGGV